MRSTVKAQSGPGSSGSSGRRSVPGVQGDRQEIASILVSDIHRSEKAPVCRAERTNWIETQNAVLDQVGELQKKHQCPVLIAGDLFDRWDASAWIINETMIHMPDRCYGVPGNHDLPNHSYKEAHRSAYWTLVEAGVLENLTPGPAQYSIDHMLVSPFPCGFKVAPPADRHGLALNVALIHDYIWTEKTGHPDAPPSGRYAQWLKRLEGYDVAVFGDNHRSILLEKEGKCTVFNCGTLMRRKTDEISYPTCVGLLHTSGRVTRHFLDISKDEFTDVGQEIAAIEQTLSVDLCGFVEEMAELRRQGQTWKKTVELWIKKNNIHPDIQVLILKAVEEST